MDHPGALIIHLTGIPFAEVILKPFTLGIGVAIVFMLLFLCLVAFVSAAESAFFSLSPTDVEELKASSTATDDRILLLTNSPKRLLATLLISINFINIAICDPNYRYSKPVQDISCNKGSIISNGYYYINIL